MPSSVLLAVLVAAGLLALAPALVRRYDATERLVAERALSAARVLSRQRRRRTVPGRRPLRPPSWLMPREVAAPAPPAAAPVRRPSPAAIRAARAERARLWRYRRRRRTLVALVLLNLVEGAGVLLLGPGLWIGLAPSALLLVGYVANLRRQVLAERHRRYAARLAARDAARRYTERLARERAERRAAAAAAAEAARRGAASYRAPRRASGPPRRPALRGYAYEARAVGY